MMFYLLLRVKRVIEQIQIPGETCMKRRILFLAALLCCFAGCSSYKSVLKNETEKVVIYIYGRNDSQIESAALKIDLTGKDEINRVLGFVSGMISPGYKCGYTGMIEYYCRDGNVILDMEFNTGCNTIVFVYGDRLYTRRISPDGLKYLKGLEDQAAGLAKQ